MAFKPILSVEVLRARKYGESMIYVDSIKKRRYANPRGDSMINAGPGA